MLKEEKKGQITIFIILAVIIVGSVAGYFLLKNKITEKEEIPKEFEQVENYFLSCIKENAETGITILGQQAGYIYLPKFEQGSEYMPTSNHLNFLGSNIPYWYYLTGNNLAKEQIPSLNEMEEQLERYIKESKCDFSDFMEKGYEIDIEELKPKVKIEERKVEVEIESQLNIKFGNLSSTISTHKIGIQSPLYEFYEQAKKIYSYEMENEFLENYTLDVLYLYAPVNGIEFECSPKIWMANEVARELKKALQENVQAIRFGKRIGNKKDYFVQTLNINKNVNFMYNPEWPTKVEIWDAQNGVMIAEPIGNQPGLGIIGFCYTPYHFVYDIAYPVLIQIYDSNFLFQFPFVVVIDKNKARKAGAGEGLQNIEPELCRYPNQEVEIYTYNTYLEPVEAELSFECLGERCDIGKTKLQDRDAIFKGLIPTCLNGFVLAENESYALEKVPFSTNKETVLNIIMNKLYPLNLTLKLAGKNTNDNAIITFSSDENFQTVAYPQQQEVKLSEGYYNISVIVYKNSTIKIPAINTKKCVETYKSGILGILGQKEEKCFDINIPEQELRGAIIGGGKFTTYITESELEQAKNITLNVERFPEPRTLEQVQDNYNLLEIKKIIMEIE